ncbi:MAG: hypothetical protein P4N41_00565 [Negativicutes bacterium]|nr:hypothetical protein [Negativicutes bacterium]
MNQEDNKPKAEEPLKTYELYFDAYNHPTSKENAYKILVREVDAENKVRRLRLLIDLSKS